ncbi:MAG: 2Fe-2S iron-sulfur cluster-binding protein [Sandaracinaceae bacterium]
MPPRRLRPPRVPVTLRVDGRPVAADEGEPLAVSLVAAGRTVFGRSVKYHRPRGPVCFAGRCDGCLMRVEGTPSVMTCRVPARDGMIASTQNVIGSARVDLLGATDYVFPGGMNHHEMFTWNRQVNRMMQKVARRIAGIGLLPDQAEEPLPSPVRPVDVLVLGAGPAGLAAAYRLAKGGRRVEVVDEETAPAYSLRLRGRVREAQDRAAQALSAGALLRPRASAVSVYPPWEDAEGASAGAAAPPVRLEPLVVCVDGPEGLVRYRPTLLVVATGRQAGAAAFEGNDTPGVFSHQGALRLLAAGVLPGERVVCAGDAAEMAYLVDVLQQAGAEVVGPVPLHALRAVRGRPDVGGADLEQGGQLRREDCDAVVVGPRPSAVFELAAQAGVGVRWAADHFALEVGDHGATAVPDVRVVGAAAGATALADAIDQARGAAEAALREGAAR